MAYIVLRAEFITSSQNDPASHNHNQHSARALHTTDHTELFSYYFFLLKEAIISMIHMEKLRLS
jgi:hypothetical protein